jgi:hypothetical protein
MRRRRQPLSPWSATRRTSREHARPADREQARGASAGVLGRLHPARDRRHDKHAPRHRQDQDAKGANATAPIPRRRNAVGRRWPFRRRACR